jgi:hypothetical protein
MPPVPSDIGGRTAVYADQAQQLAAINVYRTALDQIMAVDRAAQGSFQPAVPRPTHANPRGADARQHNRNGSVLSGQHWRVYPAEREASARCGRARDACGQAAAEGSRLQPKTCGKI